MRVFVRVCVCLCGKRVWVGVCLGAMMKCAVGNDGFFAGGGGGDEHKYKRTLHIKACSEDLKHARGAEDK